MKNLNGVLIPLVIEPLRSSPGENTIVWRPYDRDSFEEWPKPAQDETYEVTIGNVLVNGNRENFSYTAIIIDDTVPPPTPEPFRVFIPYIRTIM